MNRRSVVLAALVTGATGVVGLAAPAVAVPPGHEDRQPELFTCEGVGPVEVFGGGGRSGWVEDTLFLAVEIHVAGTFTPTDGAAEPFAFDKVWGTAPDAETIHCTADVTDSNEEGTFTAHWDVTAMVVPGHDA